MERHGTGVYKQGLWNRSGMAGGSAHGNVVFYGSSHVYSGVNVAALWDDYGIAGYDMAGTMQTLWNSYYNMEETLKYQSPRLMVVDLYGIGIEEEYYGTTNIIKNVSSMRFSLNKIKNVWNSVPHEEFLSS